MPTTPPCAPRWRNRCGASPGQYQAASWPPWRSAHSPAQCELALGKAARHLAKVTKLVPPQGQPHNPRGGAHAPSLGRTSRRSPHPHLRNLLALCARCHLGKIRARDPRPPTVASGLPASGAPAGSRPNCPVCNPLRPQVRGVAAPDLQHLPRLALAQTVLAPVRCLLAGGTVARGDVAHLPEVPFVPPKPPQKKRFVKASR